MNGSSCLNCGAGLTGPYCATCGQKTPHADLTLRELIQETTEELVHWDGKVPNTLKTLFLKPGLLTQDFLAGRRARWLPPLRIYIICSLAFFLSGPLVESITHQNAREIAKITITNPDGSKSLTPEGRKDIEQTRLGALIGRERLERAAANSNQLNQIIASVYPKAMFLLLPMFALITRWSWRRAMPRYPAHLYLALHLHAAWFGAFAAVTLISGVMPEAITVALTLAAFTYVVWYGLVAFRRLFGETWGRTIAKAAGIAVTYGICFLIVSFGMLAYAVATI